MVTMPPGMVATAPRLRNPATMRVSPGMMMKSGQPLSLRSTPVITTTRAKMPMTTSTMPIAVLEPPRGRAGSAEGLR